MTRGGIGDLSARRSHHAPPPQQTFAHWKDPGWEPLPQAPCPMSPGSQGDSRESGPREVGDSRSVAFPGRLLRLGPHQKRKVPPAPPPCPDGWGPIPVPLGITLDGTTMELLILLPRADLPVTWPSTRVGYRGSWQNRSGGPPLSARIPRGAEAGAGVGTDSRARGFFPLDLSKFLQNLRFSAMNPAYKELLTCACHLGYVLFAYMMMRPAFGGNSTGTGLSGSG